MMPLIAGFQRRPDQVIEEESAIYQKYESKYLQPLERLPTQPKRYNPDKQCSARINGGARCCADGSGDGETEEVEAAVTR